MLYEVLPDIFPQGFLTALELEVWGEYYTAREARLKRGR